MREYCGYRERTASPLLRRNLPSPHVVFIIDFGPTLRFPGRDGSVAAHAGGFASGLCESYVLSETAGAQSGIEVNFTLMGARRFFGLPMSELSGRVVGLNDLFGSAGARLVEELQEAPNWEARFARLDRLLTERIGRAAPFSTEIAWALRHIMESGGNVAVGALADEIGCSHKHLIVRFRDQIGVPPKLLARIVRFDLTLQQLDGSAPPNWAELAAACGYYDQAHLIREFRQFAGATPEEHLGQRLPEGGGVAE